MICPLCKNLITTKSIVKKLELIRFSCCPLENESYQYEVLIDNEDNRSIFWEAFEIDEFQIIFYFEDYDISFPNKITPPGIEIYQLNKSSDMPIYFSNIIPSFDFSDLNQVKNKIKVLMAFQ